MGKSKLREIASLAALPLGGCGEMRRSAHSDSISPHPPSLRFYSRSGHGECGSVLEPSHVLVSVDLVTFFLLRNRAHGFGYVLRSALTPLELSDELIRCRFRP